MKKIYRSVIALSLLFLGVNSNAQVSAYSFNQSSGTYNAITGGTVYGTTTSDDQVFIDPTNTAGSGSGSNGVGLPIGFNFGYNGSIFDVVGIDNNGWISFGQSALSPAVDMNTNSYATVISSASSASPLLQNRVAALNRDLQGQTGSEVRVQLLGSSPTRTFVVQWGNYRRYGGTGDNFNFQIRLSEGTNLINVVYGTFTTTTAGSVQVGLRGTTTSDFNNREVTSPNIWATSNAGVLNTDLVNFDATLTPSVGQTYRWSPPPVCTGAPGANTALSNASVVCSGGTANLSLANTYTPSGIVYQWFVSTTGVGGPYSAVTGGTNAAISATNITTNSFFKAVITCTNGPASTTSTPVQVNVGGNACQCNTYCSSTATSINDDEIFNVNIGTLNNTSNCSQTGGVGSVQNLYSNYTGIVAAPNLIAGANYTLNVTVGMCNTGSYSGVVTAYMDFNNNGVFTDPGELVYTSPYTLFAIAGTQVSTVITIPATASPGITRLRVVEGEGSTVQPPCGTYTWGETEDYCINIVAAVACAGAPAANSVAATATNVCPGGSSNLSLANSYTVGGLAYQWFVSTTGFGGPYTAISGATVSVYSATNITVNSYYQAVITCTNGPASTTATPVQVVVGGSPCQCASYCTSNATSTADEELFNVSIGTLNNTTSCSQTGGPGSIMNEYSTFAGIVAAPTLTAGYTYTLSVTAGECSGNSYSGIVTAYMDFNQNGVFTDPGEAVYTSTYGPIAVAGTTFTANVSLPVSATSGTTRMRVIVVEGSTPGAPCGTYSWGETEDYCINIVPPPPCTSASSGTLSATSLTACAGQSVSLNANGATIGTGIVYQWKVSPSSTGPYTNVTGGTGATTTSYTTAALTAGTTYYILQTTCTLATLTAVSNPQATVVVSPVPTAAASSVAPLCAGQNINLTSTTNIGTGFSWTGPNGFTSTVQNPVISAATSSASGSYTLLISTGACTAAPVVITVTVNSTNLSIQASPINLCSSGSSTLTAVGNATAYVWSTSATTSSIVVSPASTTVYSVTGTGASNCTATAITTVTVINPTITGVGASVCNPTTVATLSATAFGPINWYATPTSTTPLASGNTFTATAATTTTYYAQANSVASGSLLTTLAAGNGFSGNMFDVVAINSIDVNSFDMHFSSTGTATVEVWYRVGTFVGFESSNAGWTMAYTSTVNALGTGVLSPPPGTFTVTVPAGQTYGFYVTALSTGPQVNYTNGTLLGNIFVQNTDLKVLEGKGGGYFTVVNSPRVFNGAVHYTKAGCLSPVIPVTLSVSTQPTITIGVSSASVCPGSTVNIGVTGANTYTWSTGANGPLISPTISATTNYSVIGSNGPGCSTTASITITTNSVPVVGVASTASVLCVGQTASLTASGASTYSWNTSATTSVIAVSPTITTTYTVTGTGPNGCAKTTTITQVVSNCTGIAGNVISSGGILIYPNPNKGEFTVELNNGSIKNIQVMDLTGRIVLTGSSSKDKMDFNINTLANGIYYVKIQSDNTVEVIKIIKE